MRRKWKKILIFSFVGCLFITTFSLLIFNFNKPIIKNNDTSKSKYVVQIEGAVKNPGNYHFTSPKTLRSIIFNANVLTTADISLLDLEKIIDNDCEITVPYKVGSIKKIKWRDLKDVKQLTDLGIKSSVAKLIIEHRRQNETTTWERILAIKGIGQVTLNQLKDIIDLS